MSKTADAQQRKLRKGKEPLQLSEDKYRIAFERHQDNLNKVKRAERNRSEALLEANKDRLMADRYHRIGLLTKMIEQHNPIPGAFATVHPRDRKAAMERELAFLKRVCAVEAEQAIAA